MYRRCGTPEEGEVQGNGPDPDQGHGCSIGNPRNQGSNVPNPGKLISHHLFPIHSEIKSRGSNRTRSP